MMTRPMGSFFGLYNVPIYMDDSSGTEMPEESSI